MANGEKRLSSIEIKISGSETDRYYTNIQSTVQTGCQLFCNIYF